MSSSPESTLTLRTACVVSGAQSARLHWFNSVFFMYSMFISFSNMALKVLQLHESLSFAAQSAVLKSAPDQVQTLAVSELPKTSIRVSVVVPRRPQSVWRHPQHQVQGGEAV